MAEKPRDAVVKFDTYRNVQLAASRGLPCDSTGAAPLLFCELLGCEWNNFLSQNRRMHRTVGTWMIKVHVIDDRPTTTLKKPSRVVAERTWNLPLTCDTGTANGVYHGLGYRRPCGLQFCRPQKIVSGPLSSWFLLPSIHNWAQPNDSSPPCLCSIYRSTCFLVAQQQLSGDIKSTVVIMSETSLP